jgi:N-acetylmuramoyl-L-alanine amidase
MLLVLLLTLQVAPLRGATRTSELTQISGKPHLRLQTWARGYGLEVRWIKPEQTVQLSNRSHKIILTVESREAQVDGVQIWLSFPIAWRNGSAYLAQLDAQTALQPLLAPPKNRSTGTLKSVCLDPGHGGKDPGNRVGSYQEKKYTLLLAQEVRQQLARAGIKANLTRSGDSFIELPSRPDVARQRNSDLFVSLHFNAAATSRSSVRGAEVYCLTPAGASSTNARGEGGGAGWFPGNHHNEKNMALAFQVQKSVCQNLGTEDRGVRRARFAVLRDATMPAILIEAGFMSHPLEGKKIFDPSYRRQMAKAIVDGILAYKRLVETAT